MAAVFVHGNPETPVIWGPLLAALGRDDVHTPQLPGFGCPTPPGFGATKEDYAAWLEDEVERIAAASGPVDLVGHDWGGGLVPYVAARRPELIRSWSSDVLGLFHEDYVWHDFAQIWQTPGAGEEYFAQSAATPVADRVALLGSLGIPEPVAAQLVEAGDDEMARCVLALYRSATQPAMTRWGETLGALRALPGLAVVAPLDPFVRGEDLGVTVAGRLGARVERLEGQGHWWMLGDPVGAAAVFRSFWASLDRA